MAVAGQGRFRSVENPGFLAVQCSAHDHKIEERFAYSGGVDQPGLHHCCGRKMASAVTKLEIDLGINSRLFELQTRRSTGASRVDITKCKLLPSKVSERMDRRVDGGG